MDCSPNSDEGSNSLCMHMLIKADKIPSTKQTPPPFKKKKGKKKIQSMFPPPTPSRESRP